MISGYCYPEINWFPGQNTRKCAEYSCENLLIFAQISRNIHKSCFLRKCPGIVTRKSIDFWVTILGNVLNISEKICWFLPRFQGIFTKVVFLENVWVSLPGNKLISMYCYSEINLFPGIVTRKLLRKKPNFVNISVKTKIFSKIF